MKDSKTISTIASFGATGRITPVGGVSIHANGNLFGTTSDDSRFGAGTIWKIAHGTSTITTLATFNTSNGSTPFGGVVIDSTGNLYGTTRTGARPVRAPYSS